MTAAMNAGQQRLCSVWISDVHLGSRDCRADYLLDFLRRVECETLYLLGDVVDFWAMKRQFLWPSSHYEVLRLIMQKARNGTRVVYLPGNHDEVVREFVGHAFGPVEIVDELVHTTVDGRRLLLFHGDVLDMHVQLDRLSRYLGDAAYDLLMWLHRWTNRARGVLGLPYWSLASYLKTRNGKAVKAIRAFEDAALAEARRRGLDGVVCGHIHHAEITERDGLLYCNDGDWVESCTALVEGLDGGLRILHWSDLCHPLKQQLQASNDAEPLVLLRVREDA
jgi:UDP-2,3-diacylglucosamine pyrophosphatase LpxH